MKGLSLGGLRRFGYIGLCVVALATFVSLAQSAEGDPLQVPAKTVPVPGTEKPSGYAGAASRQGGEDNH